MEYREGSANFRVTRLPVEVHTARAPDIPSIMDLVNTEHRVSNAVLEVDLKEVRNWVDRRLSIVARMDGEIIAHQSAYVWPESGWIELRGAVVKEEFRNKGIHSTMTQFQVEDFLRREPEATICSVKNHESKGLRLLHAMGFREVPVALAPQELFTIGEGQEWKVFVITADSYGRNMELAGCIRKEGG